ncbi:MAG: FAD-dependent monooxygenase [Burkholderiales bacterium]|nr:FAD-dependent monooxygenase [Burkholderiales bacterium]
MTSVTRPLISDCHLAIVGAGPVGAALALAIAEAGLDVVALDARPPGATLRGDRSLAISHGGRLILERLGVWSALAVTRQAVTPITTIDVSQAGGFGVTRLTADEQGVPALGYVVSYRALTQALDAALARTRTAVRYGVDVRAVRGTPEHAIVDTDADVPLRAQLAVVADGTGAAVQGVRRTHRDYAQTAVVAKITTREAHRNVAYERFTASGPIALLPEGDRYGLIWTLPPAVATQVLAWPEATFVAELARCFGARRDDFVAVADRRSFPLALDYARPTAVERCVLIGNAAQALHPIAGQGFNLGLRDAFALAQAINGTPPALLGTHGFIARHVARRSADRHVGIRFTDGLVRLFASDHALLRWPRGIGLALLDALPPAKRALTRTMLFGP